MNMYLNPYDDFRGPVTENYKKLKIPLTNINMYCFIKYYVDFRGQGQGRKIFKKS